MSKRIDRINNFRYPISQPTVFDEEELTVLELVSKIAYKINETVGEVNNWFDYLDDFVEVFDENLQDKVTKTLTEWQDSGLLDVIIDEALQTQIDVLEDETHTKLELFDTQLGDLENKITWTNIEQFPRLNGETDDSPRINRALNSLTNGGVLFGGNKTYICASTITIPQNISLIGVGSGRYSTGTNFKYTGTGTLFTFEKITAGIKLSNFKISVKQADDNYQNFTAIDVNRGEMLSIDNVLIEGAKIGIDITGTVGPIYLLQITNIFIFNCLNEGIYVRDTGSWKNGIYISIGDISANGIGIRGAKGEGNIIEGKASEVGRNSIGIRLEGGVWTIKGALWMENNTIGIDVLGGHHILDGDIRNIDFININGGFLFNNAIQSYVSPSYRGINKKGLKYWYSFDEGEGLYAYDKTKGQKVTFTKPPLWNTETGYFNDTVTGATTYLPNTVDWTKDWTVIILGKGPNSQNLLQVKGEGHEKDITVRYFPKGVQILLESYNNGNTYPNGDLTLNMDWTIFGYDSVNKKIEIYSRIGKVMVTIPYNIPNDFVNPEYVRVCNTDIVLDEIGVYNRLLDPREINEITRLKTIPDFQSSSDGQYILKSPDGARWKQTIGDDGNVTWTKL